MEKPFFVGPVTFCVLTGGGSDSELAHSIDMWEIPSHAEALLLRDKLENTDIPDLYIVIRPIPTTAPLKDIFEKVCFDEGVDDVWEQDEDEDPYNNMPEPSDE